MITQNKKEIDDILSKAKWILLLGLLIIISIPLLLTQPFFHKAFDFSSTGQIGDTIGGTTAPFLNLIGAILIFYALKAQVKANELIQDQIDKENDEKELEKETSVLNQLYSYLDQSINNFTFKTLPEGNLTNVDVPFNTETEKGGEAFYKLFSQIFCNYHGTLPELFQNQSVSELFSILTLMELLLNKLANSRSNSKDMLVTLIKHQFNYRVITRIRDLDKENLELDFCNQCNCNHGLPDEIRDLIDKIRDHF